MDNEIRRATGLLVIEVVNSNPNGDPDRESDPRQRPNGLGEISPVSFKRKLRDLLEDHDSLFFQNLPKQYVSHAEQYCILESRGRELKKVQAEMSDDKSSFEEDKFLNSAFVKKYWDARIFGNTFLQKDANKGFIKTGVVQFGVGVSVAPIEIVRQSNTKKAPVQEDKSAGMAPLAFRIAEHGVYCMPFFVNPNLAKKTGCTAADIELLKLLIPHAYDLNRSAIRPDVRIRHAWYLEHQSPLGSCPEYLLLDALTPVKIENPSDPSTKWSDYEDKTELPETLKSRLYSVTDLMNRCYLAHSAKDGYPEQTYQEHVSHVLRDAEKNAEEAARFAQHDGDLLRDIVEKAAALHDLGKLDPENQSSLQKSDGKGRLPVNHVDAGAAHYLQKENFSAFSAAAIYAHHRGFPDFIEERNKGELKFRDLDIHDRVDQELPQLEAIHRSLIVSEFQKQPEAVRGNRQVFLRVLFSCLADADHTDTARHYGKYPKVEPETPLLRAGERLEALNRYVESLQKESDPEKKERNDLRMRLYEHCRDAEIHGGICTCDGPVGSGKTTAIMAHLLHQARQRNLRRIFIILPFTNIIQQSVDIYREALVLPGENPNDVVAELHHRVDFETEEIRHLTALWRAPIIVTTAVAFFETLASNSPAALRRLHELPGSAVFVDESHAALPIKLLPLAWKWINVFAQDWSCYWVMASGSLCKFWEIPDFTAKEDSQKVPEIIQEPLHSELAVFEKKRVKFRWNPSPLSSDELVEWIGGFHGPRLLILNTVQSAAVVAYKISKRYGRGAVEHLSTALTAENREKTIARIHARLKNKEDADWTLVATSCVEAGVNFDFHIGFRELCSLTSLLQTSGRVNREGNLDSEVWSFSLRDDEQIQKNPGVNASLEVLREYLERQIEITPDLSTKALKDEIMRYAKGEEPHKLLDDEQNQSFITVEQEFRVIDSDTRIVIVDHDLAERIQYGFTDWKMIQKKSVQVSTHKLKKLQIPQIYKDIYEWNLDYDDFIGYMAGIVPMIELQNENYIL